MSTSPCLASTTIFEVVSGQIRLGKRARFCELHSQVLLPMMRSVGIEPHLLTISELGRYLHFCNIYKYSSMQDYATKTDLLLAQQGIGAYYEQIQQCVHGAIQVEIAVAIPIPGASGPGNSST